MFIIHTSFAFYMLSTELSLQFLLNMTRWRSRMKYHAS